MGLKSSSGAPCPGRTAARLARQVEIALSDVDLSLPQYRVLIHLDEGLLHKGDKTKIAASALADRLAVSRPSITGVVDGLVQKGFVERHHDPGDRRRVGHNLTAKGRAVLRKADESVNRRLLDIAYVAQPDRAPRPNDDGVAGNAGQVAHTGQAAQAFGSLEQWRAALDAYRAVNRGAGKGGETKPESKGDTKTVTKTAVVAK
ncbi:MAG: MarR family transcriptional regulator [Acidimicrobiales bacterium]